MNARGHGPDGDVGDEPAAGIFDVHMAPARAWMPVYRRPGTDEPEPGRSTAVDASELVPAWVRQLGTAVWISDPCGTMVYMNARAEELLGVAWEECAGRTCAGIVGGRDASGKKLCRKNCKVMHMAGKGREIQPLRVQVGDADDPHWLHVTLIPVEAADGTWPWLVHCALDVNRIQRIEAYVRRLATRSDALRRQEPPAPDPELTRRESEILELLVQDVELGAIAARLGISLTTVRNHTQHVLTKLGAHSVPEAIAIHLLARR